MSVSVSEREKLSRVPFGTHAKTLLVWQQKRGCADLCSAVCTIYQESAIYYGKGAETYEI